MPKRMVDGEALWTSGKLKKVQPPEYRLHYANWLPLAEANGVFEANIDAIHARLYAFLLPKFTILDTKKLYRAFIKAGLLEIWTEESKSWAYFTGIGKEGRLPSSKHLERYKFLPPNPPSSRTSPGTSGNDPRGFGVGVGVGSDMDRIGLEETDMSAFKDKIGQLAWENLKVTILPTDKAYSELLARARIVGGQDKLADAFEDFCRDHAGEPIAYPLGMFLKVLDGYVLSSSVQTSAEDRAKPVIDEMVAISDGEVKFEKKHQIIIRNFLQLFAPWEVTAAFKEFWGQVSGDDFQVKHAARVFTETLEQTVTLQRRRREDARKQQGLISQTIVQEQKKAENERLERQRADEVENALIEDELPR